jgi:hypothetical protein
MNIFLRYFVRRSYDYEMSRLCHEDGCQVCLALPYIKHSNMLRGKRAVPPVYPDFIVLL